MNALQFTATGDLAHLSLVEVPVPVPSAGEVLVKVNAAGLNPSDVKTCLAVSPTPRCHASLGVTSQEWWWKARRRCSARRFGAPVVTWVFSLTVPMPNTCACQPRAWRTNLRT